jgi:hypothetical protein
MSIEHYDIKEEEICGVEERYLAFIDETGDPFIHKDRNRYNDPTVFPVLTVSALIVSTTVYKEVLRPAIDDIKMHFWGTRDIHFHSNEIRRKDGIFKVLLDPAKYEEFKEMMVGALEKSSITLVSSSINKMKLLDKAERFKKNTGNEYNAGDLYLTNVGWVLERIGHFVKNDTVRIVFETRGRKESRRIQGVLTTAKQNGTFYHSKDRFKNICEEILFFTKEENVNGIQMADYCTYPFVRHAKDSTDDNKLFDLLRPFVYQGDYSEYGLKEWP